MYVFLTCVILFSTVHPGNCTAHPILYIWQSKAQNHSLCYGNSEQRFKCFNETTF